MHRFFRLAWGRERADCCAIQRPIHAGGSGHEREAAGGAFVVHDLCAYDSDMRRDQRWRERPRLEGLGPPSGQGSGVVHAIVGSATVTPAAVMTAAQSAASRSCARQLAAIETLARICAHGATRGEGLSGEVVESGGPT
jgi:hypothetical protein